MNVRWIFFFIFFNVFVFSFEQKKDLLQLVPFDTPSFFYRDYGTALSVSAAAFFANYGLIRTIVSWCSDYAERSLVHHWYYAYIRSISNVTEREHAVVSLIQEVHMYAAQAKTFLTGVGVFLLMLWIAKKLYTHTNFRLYQSEYNSYVDDYVTDLMLIREVCRRLESMQKKLISEDVEWASWTKSFRSLVQREVCILNMYATDVIDAQGFLWKRVSCYGEGRYDVVWDAHDGAFFIPCNNRELFTHVREWSSCFDALEEADEKNQSWKCFSEKVKHGLYVIYHCYEAVSFQRKVFLGHIRKRYVW